MLKYVNSDIVFQEIPDEVTLAINISNCPCHCPGCHSRYLWDDVGLPLNPEAIDDFVGKYGSDLTCIAFMGATATLRVSICSHSMSMRSIRICAWPGTADVPSSLLSFKKTISTI